MDWQIYVLFCSDDSLYCGISKDVQRRLRQHNLGAGAKYTFARRPVRLAAVSHVRLDRSTALKAEYAFKKLRRVKKLAYVRIGIDIFLKDYGYVEKNYCSVDD